jgi:hypothetical protein
MRLKEEIRQRLAQGEDEDEQLRQRAIEEPRCIRLLQARLWDVDATVRRRAAWALGHAAAAHPALGLELIRRLMWALNDESVTHGVFGIPALGEIGRRAPDLLVPFLGAMAMAARDDAGLRLALLQAFAAMAESAPAAVAPHLESLRRAAERAEEIAALRAIERCLEE